MIRAFENGTDMSDPNIHERERKSSCLKETRVKPMTVCGKSTKMLPMPIL